MFRFLWITNPWASLDRPNDTTLRLMEESFLQGFENYWCDVKSIKLDSSRIQLSARKLTRIKRTTFQFEIEKFFSPSYFNSIQYRTDPPIDHAYIHPLQLLSLGVRNSIQTQIVNPPSVLLLENEKFGASHFENLLPATIVSSQLKTLLDFGKKEKNAVLKPLYQAQSKGIQLLKFETKNEIQKSTAALFRLTRNFSQPVLLQKYLPTILQGETRLWFLDGRLLAHIRKIPMTGQFRIDMDHGGSLAPSELTTKEKKSIPVISKGLKKLGVRLAAIDLIDGLITDFNFTSPGLLTQMERVLDVNLAKKVIHALANRT